MTSNFSTRFVSVNGETARCNDLPKLEIREDSRNCHTFQKLGQPFCDFPQPCGGGWAIAKMEKANGQA